MWFLHKDHHKKDHKSWFERNDMFFLQYAAISIFFTVLWGEYNLWLGLPIAIGIFMYGLAYFIVHDVIIHQRFKWFSRSNNTYIKALKWAHKMHHKHLQKEKSESFGLLLVGKKYWNKVLKDKAIRKQKSHLKN